MKIAIGFGIGLVVGIASIIIGLRGYANDPFVPQEIQTAIPSVTHLMALALKGSALIWLIAFFIGLSIVAIGWLVAERSRRRRDQ